MTASDEDAEDTIGRAAAHRPTLDHNMVYVAGENLKLCPVCDHEIRQQVRKGVKSVKLPHLKSISASDQDAEHTTGRAVTHRPTLDHNMVYTAGKNLILHPVCNHEIGAKRCTKCQNNPSQLVAGI
jgi:hypothetical protein